VPLRAVFPFLGKIARTVGDFQAAEGVSLLDWRDERIGVAVCFEVVFPGETAELVREGATLLATVTNDAWYGDTAAPRQHLRAARFRAAENRRWLLRAAVTGISAIVRPDGTLAAELGVGEEGTIPVPVFGRRDLSPYTRAPWLVPWLAVLFAVAAWLASCLGDRRA
jgi:apolipoprotein N-acyltransferase